MSSDGPAFRMSAPSPEGVARLGRELGTEIVAVERLGGGLAAATSLLRTASGDELVMKRFQPGDGTPPSEWERLRFVWDRVDVPRPEPLVADLSGEWFGTPVIVMRRLPGRATFDGDDAWLRELAETSARIHATDVTGAEGALLRPHRVVDWHPPTRVRRTARADRIVAAVEAALPGVDRTPTTLLHDDYHPGNVLWSDGRISGVVDWSPTRLGPRTLEVSYCRTDIALLFGARAADRYAAHYAAASGADLADLPVWDLVQCLIAMTWFRAWLGAYAEQGHAIPADTARRRLTTFTDRALQRLSG